jgi:hypothetical protein
MEISSIQQIARKGRETRARLCGLAPFLQRLSGNIPQDSFRFWQFIWCFRAPKA